MPTGSYSLFCGADFELGCSYFCLCPTRPTNPQHGISSFNGDTVPPGPPASHTAVHRPKHRWIGSVFDFLFSAFRSSSPLQGAGGAGALPRRVRTAYSRTRCLPHLRVGKSLTNPTQNQSCKADARRFRLSLSWFQLLRRLTGAIKGLTGKLPHLSKFLDNLAR